MASPGFLNEKKFYKMTSPEFNSTPIRKCLVDGVEHEYYCCSTRKDAYKKTNLRLTWLGKGTITTINGVLQTGKKKYNFWKILTA